jgi:hypothetical protein
VPPGPCSGHVGACAGPYPRGNAGRECEGQPHGQARGHPGEATRRRTGRSQGATGRMPPPLVVLLLIRFPAVAHVIAGSRKRAPASNWWPTSGFTFRPATTESVRARGGQPGRIRVPAPLGNTGGSSRTNPESARGRLGGRNSPFTGEPDNPSLASASSRRSARLLRFRPRSAEARRTGRSVHRSSLWTVATRLRQIKARGKCL